jgi:ribonuclease BN (tRNA processing enzyme)
MTRTFHPIGQSAFYSEKFESGFTIVYDCGGSTKAIVEQEIQNSFEKDEKIDIVFISHFHNDHINGLEFLLKYCDVQKVVLPLTPYVRIVVQNL